MKTVLGEVISGPVVGDGTAFQNCDLSAATVAFDGTGRVEFSDCTGLDRARFTVGGEPASYEAFVRAVVSWGPPRLDKPRHDEA